MSKVEIPGKVLLGCGILESFWDKEFIDFYGHPDRRAELEPKIQKWNEIHPDKPINLDFDKGERVLEGVHEYASYLENAKKHGISLFLWGPNGTGKAQPLYSRVLTDRGWKRMGDIKLKDKVMTPKGSKSEVVGVFPQGKKKCYRVRTLDGRETYCCDEHLWSCLTSRGNLKNFTLREMIDKGFKTNGGEYRFYIPNNKAIPYEEKELPIEPYLLGVLLGDDCLTESQCGLAFSNAESDIIEKVSLIVGNKYEVKENTGDNHTFTIQNIPSYRDNKINKAIRKLGLRVRSTERFIPEVYLKSSINQRLEVLKGLMDTDGSVKRNGSFTFSTKSKKLFKDVQELSRSIGIQCSGHKFDRDSGVEYEINFLTNKIIVSSKKHLIKLKKATDETKGSRNCSKYEKTAIVEAEFVGYEEMQCIMIDDEEHLYLTDDYIVTHNTMLGTCVLKEAIRRGYSCQMTSLGGIIEVYSEGWANPEKKELFNRRIKDVDFLLIDDIGKEYRSKNNDLVEVAFDNLIRYRVMRNKPFILTTNTDMARLKSVYGQSIASLLYGRAISIEVGGGDYRALIQAKDLRRRLHGE